MLQGISRRRVFTYLILLAILLAAISAFYGNRIRLNEIAVREASHGDCYANLDWLLWFIPALVVINGLIIGLFTYIIRDRLRQQIEMLTIATEQMSMGNFRHLEFPPTDDPINDLSHTVSSVSS